MVGQWHKEIQKHLAPTHQPAVSTRLQRFAKSDVVIVNYQHLRSVYHRDPRGVLFSTGFTALILDEAHCIRNAHNLSFRAVQSIQARRTYCVTATPINNSVRDLCTLCQVMRLRPFDSFSWWKRHQNNRVQIDYFRRKFCLRREKGLLGLAPIRFETVEIELSNPERKFYNGVLARLIDSSKSFDLNRILIFLLHLRQWCCHPRLVLPGTGIPSSKTLALHRRLRELLERHLEAKQLDLNCYLSLPAEDVAAALAGFPKVVIFSQWITFLNLIEEEVLVPLRLSFLRLDGDCTLSARARLVSDFQEDPTIAVFCCTTGAGGVGLTLTAAEQIFLMDYWFNPFTDLQAINRVHRIGQTKQVTAVRFQIKDSIEVNIRQIQLRKQGIADKILGNVDPDDSLVKETTNFDEEDDGSLNLLRLGRVLLEQNK